MLTDGLFALIRLFDCAKFIQLTIRIHGKNLSKQHSITTKIKRRRRRKGGGGGGGHTHTHTHTHTEREREREDITANLTAPVSVA